jgi:hypothetical protein
VSTNESHYIPESHYIRIPVFAATALLGIAILLHAWILTEIVALKVKLGELTVLVHQLKVTMDHDTVHK